MVTHGCIQRLHVLVFCQLIPIKADRRNHVLNYFGVMVDGSIEYSNINAAQSLMVSVLLAILQAARSEVSKLYRPGATLMTS